MLSYRVMNMVYGQPALLQDDIDNALILGYWPDKENNTMYVWIKHNKQHKPISYSMPYSIKLHKSLQQGRKQHEGKPYRAEIKGRSYPLERFRESIDDIEITPMEMLPPKEQ
jgi:hypothetical protein